MREEWKSIPGYEGFYEASTHGRIRSVDRRITRTDGVVQALKGVILSPAINQSGYENVSLRKDRKARSFLVSRLIAMTFLPNDQNLPEVNHKDENKLNNRVDNLEWVSHLDNCNHGTRNERHSEYMRTNSFGENHSHPSPVVCLTTRERFACMREAGERYGMKSISGISKCCREKKGHAGRLNDGTLLEWRYANS